MNPTKYLSLLCGVSLFVLQPTSRGQVATPITEPDLQKPAAAVTAPAPVRPTTTPVKTDDSAKNLTEIAKPATSKVVELTVDKLANPEKPERPEPPKPAAALGRSDEIKKLIDQFTEARNAFLDEEKELRRKYTNAGKEERERLREQIKEKRQAFLNDQKEAREELRKRTVELIDQLKDHRGILDAAKDQAREDVKRRKGGKD